MLLWLSLVSWFISPLNLKFVSKWSVKFILLQLNSQKINKVEWFHTCSSQIFLHPSSKDLSQEHSNFGKFVPGQNWMKFSPSYHIPLHCPRFYWGNYLSKRMVSWFIDIFLLKLTNTHWFTTCVSRISILKSIFPR